METTTNQKERVINISTMHKNDDVLRISSNGESIDFSKSSISIKIYFDGDLFRDEFLKLAVYNQPQKNVYQVMVPKNASTAKLILNTTGDEDLRLINWGLTKRTF